MIWNRASAINPARPALEVGEAPALRESTARAMMSLH